MLRDIRRGIIADTHGGSHGRLGFDSWTPPCGREPTCTLAIGNHDASVGAAFRHLYAVGVHVDRERKDLADTAPLTTCKSSCSGNYRSDATVVLRAVPAAGSHFVHWTGDCDGTAPACSLATDSPADTTATFAIGALPPSSVRVTTTRGGAVVQAGSSLAAVPQSGFAFQGWSGACTGSGTCATSVGDIRATFRHLYRLSVVRQNPTTFASRDVVSSPAGINCGTTCSALFRSDATVTLTTTAVPFAALFSSWDGGCSGGTPVRISIEGLCLVAVDADTEVTANFRAPVFGIVTYAINVTVVGPGKVSSSPVGIDCGLQCSASATDRVILMAHAEPLRSRFVTWTGACTGTGPCVVRPPSQPVAATFVACTLRLVSIEVTRPKARRVRVSFAASEPALVTIKVGRKNKAPFANSNVNAGLAPTRARSPCPQRQQTSIFRYDLREGPLRRHACSRHEVGVNGANEAAATPPRRLRQGAGCGRDVDRSDHRAGTPWSGPT